MCTRICRCLCTWWTALDITSYGTMATHTHTHTHTHRCRVLVHVIDGSSRDPLYDFKAIQNELEMFSPELLAKPQVFVLDSIIILSLVFVAM